MSKSLFFKRRLEQLEERVVLSISPTVNLTPPQTAYENLVQASVVGENVFYGDSAFDGFQTTASAADDAAIATDKTALLPGQTASFGNYTSYAQGINGIMVDIAGLPSNVTASDFSFMVGNSDQTSAWTQLAVAPTVTVRWGAGVGGSARVELTWPNNAIQNEWLQVTVLADADTGLSANDAFYFGNAIGSTGISPTSAQVTSADASAVQANETQTAGVTNAYDINRNGSVNATDVSIVQNNLTTPANALNLITVPAAPHVAPFSTEQPSFMEANAQFSSFFDPLIIETNDGTLISVSEGREGSGDRSVEGIVETTSTDGGQTWSLVTTIYNVPNFPTSITGLGSLVVDHTTGVVYLFFTNNDVDPMMMSSSNDGQTWSTPQDMTAELNWNGGWISFGPNNGIQLTTGPYAGRLMVALDYRTNNNPSGPSFDEVMYSDDDGASWQIGGGPANSGVNEATIVQLSDGAIYMNSRDNSGTYPQGDRQTSISTDGGMTWTNMQPDFSLPVPSVEGSLIRLDPNTLVFAAPDDVDGNSVRQQMTLWASFNDGQSWVEERVINYEFASYSDMVAMGNDTAMLVFDVGQLPTLNASINKIDMVKFNLTSLLDGQSQPAQFTYTFNEEPIGQSAPIGGSSIRDDGPLDQRGTVQSSGGVPYYVQGSDGNEALRIVNGSNINLSPAQSDGMQIKTNSFTFEFVLRTTDANGVLLGEAETGPGSTTPGYTFSLVNGNITFFVNDGSHTVTLTGTTIDDGNWHDVVGIRNAQNHTVSLYVDGRMVAEAADSTGDILNNDNVTLGSYQDGTDQLTFDIQLLQVTQAALTPAQFLTASYQAPLTLPTPTTPASNMLSLPGLSFLLGPYDDRHYFADDNEGDPLLIQPTVGTPVFSAIDDTGVFDSLAAQTVNYETDPTVGSYWSAPGTSGWLVQNSNGVQSPTSNFDFVQENETFTVSGVFNVPAVPSSGILTLVGNNQSNALLSGFNLTVDSTGNLDFNITDGNGRSGTTLVNQSLATFNAGGGSGPTLATGTWYQIVVVGNGAGTPLTYYLTPMTASAVQQYQGTSNVIAGTANAITRASQDLEIGNAAHATLATGTPTVNFNDVAVFNQALTPSQVGQMLVDDSLATVSSGANSTYTPGGPAAAVDAGVTVSSGDSDLTGATVTILAGTLQSGDLLSFTSQNGITSSYSGGVLTLSGSATPAQYQAALQSVTFSSTNTSTATRDISTQVTDSLGDITSQPAPTEIIVSAPATITGVYVSSTAWTSIFDAYLANNGLGSTVTPSLGYALQTGAAQLTTLPWSNINTIDVQFSEPVFGVSTDALKLVGGTGTGAVAAPTVTGVTALANNVYQFNLSGPLGNNKYVIAVPSTGSSFGPPIADANGAGISGTFTTSSSAFPSGNGLAGSTFDFSFNVLPGDGNQNGLVNAADAAAAKAHLNARTTTSGYSPYVDFNGAGVINANDVNIDNSHLNNRQSSITAPMAPSGLLAAGALVGGTGSAGFTALALGVQETGTSQTSGSSTSSAAAVSTPSAAATSSTPPATSSTASSGSASELTPAASRNHGRHEFAAVDEAVSQFDLTDLWA